MSVLEEILEEIEEQLRIVKNIPDHEDGDFMDGEECYEAGRVQGRYEELVRCKEIIRSHMDEVENDGWIPVEERLPEEGIEVLAQFTVRVVHINNEVDEVVYIHTMYCENGIWKSFAGVPNGKVEAWHPLPEPYKEDKQDERI